MPKSAPLLERIKACLEKHPDWDDVRVAAAIVGSRRELVRAVRAGEPLPETVTAIVEVTPKGQLTSGVTLISLDDIKRKYDLYAQILEVICDLPSGQVISETDLRACIQTPDPLRFKRTIEAHEKELEPYRIMLKYKSSEARYHYAKPEVISDLRNILEKP
jgi:hypothetical protein